MNMLFFNSCILIFCIGTLEAAVIRDSFKDEGGGSSNSNSATAASKPTIYPEKHIHFEYPLEKPYPGNEYIKISILSRSKFPNPLPDPRVIWNRTIPFIIYKRSSPKEKTLILNVIKWFNTETCIKFVEGNSDDIFITITPRSWLTHSLCRTKEHRRNLRKLAQGIFYDIKFVLDFGLIGEDSTDTTEYGTSVNLSIRKLNDFYSCDKGSFSLQSRDDATWIHSRKKRSLEDIDDDENIASLAPGTPETSGFGESYSIRNRGDEIADLLLGQLIEESEETLKDDILLTATKPTIVGNNTITLPSTDNKSKTIDDSILFRINEKITSDIVDKSTSVTGAISTNQVLPSSTTASEGVAMKETTSSRSKESTANPVFISTATDKVVSSAIANSVILSMATNNAISSKVTDKVVSSTIANNVISSMATNNAISSKVTDKVVLSTIANNVISSMAKNNAISSKVTNDAVSSIAANNGKASSDEIEVTAEGNGERSTVTRTVNMQPVAFRSGDFVAAKEPNGKIKVDTTSPASRKLGLLSGAKEVILSDSKVIVVDEHSVHEHVIGTEHQHLHGRSGTLKDDEDEEHDGFHQVDVIDGNPIKGRTALRDPTKLWTDGVIPYVLSDKYDARQKQLVIEGIEEFHNKTCVKFVKRTNEKSYMFLQPDSRCSATIGKVKDGVNNVTISDGCFVPGIIVHELMHVMGFIHEQNRPDRDSYVMIVWNNVIPKTRGNFKKYRKGDVQDFGQGYDYESVMHYGMYDFAINLERPTIIPLKPGANIGQRDGFSRKDLIKVNKLFRCDEAPEDDEGGTDHGYEIEFRRRPLDRKIIPRNDFKKRFLKYLKKIFKALFVSLQTFARVEV